MVNEYEDRLFASLILIFILFSLITSSPYKSLTQFESINLGSGEYSIYAVYDPSNGYIYVVNCGNNTVSIYNGTRLLGLINTASHPVYAVYDPSNGYIYVMDCYSNSVTIINGTHIVYCLSVGGSPHYAVYDPSNGYIYVETSNGVYVIYNTSEVTILQSGYDPGKLIYDPSNGYVYLINSGSNDISVYYGTKFLGYVPTGKFSVYALYDPSNGYVYVVNSGSVSIINGTYNIANISLGNKGDLDYAVYDPQNNYVYVINNFGSVFVLYNSKVIANLSAPFDSDYALYDPLNGYIYVLTNYGNNISVYYGTSFLGFISTGYNPNYALFDPSDGLIFVLNSGSSSVSIINGTQIVGSMYLGTFTRPVYAVYDPSNGYIYVTDDSNVISIIVPNNGFRTFTIKVGLGPTGEVYDPQNGYIYVSNVFSQNISIIYNDKVIGSVSTPGITRNPHIDISSLVYDPQNGYVYITTAFNNIYVISGTQLIETLHINYTGYWGVYDPQNNYVYVVATSSGYSNGCVYVIQNTYIIDSIPLQHHPTFITYDPSNGYVYVIQSCLDNREGYVTILDGTSVIAENISVGDEPVYALSNPQNGYVYVYGYAYYYSPGYIVIMNGTKVIGNITVSDSPGFMLYDPQNGYLYYTSEINDIICVIQGTKIIDSIEDYYDPCYLVYDPQNGLIFVLDLVSGFVTVINNTEIVATLNVNNTNSYRYGIYDPQNGHLYLTSCISAKVGVIAPFFMINTLPHYTISFSETGLVKGTTWSVTVCGITKSSNSNEIDFSLPQGTYTYVISPPPGYKSKPLFGIISVSNNKTINFTFTPSITYYFNIQYVGNPLPITPVITLTIPNGSVENVIPPVSLALPPSTKFQIKHVIQFGDYRWVSNVQNGTVNEGNSNITILYYEQLYANVSSQFPVYALINGKNQTFTSGWYNYSTSIIIENKTYYVSPVERYVMINLPKNQFTITSPISLTFDFQKQYLVTVSSSYPVSINGVNTSSMWVNASSTIVLNAKIPFYLKGVFVGSENISLGGSVTVNQPISEKLVTSLNRSLVGEVIILLILGFTTPIVVRRVTVMKRNKISKGNNTVTIPQTPPPKATTQSVPTLINIDPYVWVGKTLYGYKVVDVIGKGGNGYVLKAELGGNGYAIKVFSVYSSPSSRTLTLRSLSTFEEIYNESSNLVKLSKHQNIVRIYGVHVDLNGISEIMKGNVAAYLDDPPLIVMEYMKGGSVDKLMKIDYLVNSSYWPLIVKEIVKQVASALSFIHSNGYVHLDVKPQNIFLAFEPYGPADMIYVNITNNNVKLGDLGSAVKNGSKIEQITPVYAPPDQVEAIITGKGADSKMDIFALGVTAYTLLKGKNEYLAGGYLSTAVDEYLNGNVSNALNYLRLAKQELQSWNLDFPPNTPLELRKFIEKALSLDPKKRPTADEVVNMLG